MALPSYKALLDDPKFQRASVDEQNQLNDKYWSLYDKENPGDPWAQQMRTATYGLFGTKKQLADAPPIKQRELDLQREAFNFSVNLGVADKEGMWSSPEQRLEAINAKQADFNTRKTELDKTMSLFHDPKVDEAMQPAWQALTSSASMGEVFNAPDTWSDAALKGVSYVASAGGSSERRDKARADYDKYRSTMAQDFGLTTDEVDDLVKHRLDKQPDPVSQDVAGTVHFRTDLLVRPTSEIEQAIADSKLPDSVKETARKEAPGKIALFKNGVLDRVKKDYPELAADMNWTGTVDNDYATLTGKLNKDWPEQLGGGVTGAGLSGLFANVPSYAMAPQPGVVPVSSREQITNEIDRQRGMEASAKKQQAVNELSSFINSDKTKIFNVDAATVGQGVYSVGESVLLGAMTGGAGTALVSADRIAKAGKIGKALLGFSKGALNTAPVAGIYGAQQGLQTYEQALTSDDPKVRENAANLAVGSAAIEFGVTTVFGGIGLGGTEDYASKLASPVLRKEAAMTIGKAWKNLAKNAGEAVVGEVPEEALITALDSVHIQQKLNPQMTDADVRKAIYDTIVSTALTTAPLGGIKAVKEGFKDFSNATTHDRSTDELKRESNDIYKAAAQESMAEEQAAGRNAAPPSAERVAELGTERTQLTERLRKSPPGGQAWLAAKERILEINDQIGEPKNEQDTTTPGGEANASQALQLPEVPVEPTAPAGVVEAGSAPQGAGTAEAQAQTSVVDIRGTKNDQMRREFAGLPEVTDQEAADNAQQQLDSFSPGTKFTDKLGRVWTKDDTGDWVSTYVGIEDSPGAGGREVTKWQTAKELAPIALGQKLELPAQAETPTETLPAGPAVPSTEGAASVAQPTTTPTNENQKQETSGTAPVESVPAQPAAEGEAEAGAALGSGQDQEAFQTLKPEDIKSIAPHLSDGAAELGALLFNITAPDIPKPLELRGAAPQQKMVQGELFQEDQPTASQVASGLTKNQRDVAVKRIRQSKMSPRDVVSALATLNPSDVMSITEKLDDTTLRRLTGGADNKRLVMLSALRNNINGRRAAMPSSTGTSPMQDEQLRKPVDRVAARVTGGQTLLQQDTTPLPEAEVPSRQATKTEEAGGLSYAELEAHPTALRKIVNKLRIHKVFRVGPGNTKQAAKRIMDQMVSNILKIHDMVPKDIRDKSKLWYSGANKISHQWSAKFGVSTQAVAGVIAAMSPQKDWFQNVSLAERLLSIWTGQDRETDTFNESMRDAAKKMDAAQAKAAKGKGYLLVEGEEVPLMAHEANLNRLMDKRFDDLEAEDKAFFVRLYDSTYNDPSYALVSPDGRFGKFHNNKDGKPTRIAWGSNTEVSKAIRILENPGVSNISEQLGKAHKIRSFYNNIVNPASDETVTSDTHAVAVAYLLPLSGSSMEVSHNFGGTGSGSFKGTYAFITEAYRRAAAERGIKPSQMQSITWEAIREIFTAATKRNESTVAKIRKLWEDYSRGKTDKSYEQTADEAIAAGGGYAFPAWYRQSELGFGDSGTSFDRDTTFTSKRGGTGANGLRAGAGRGNGRGSQSARPGPQGSAEQGTLFQAEQPQRPGVTRGSITFAADMGKAWITLMQHANASTFPHELAHFLRRFVLADNAEARALAARRGISVEEIQNLAKWAGVGADGVWTREAEEKFARGFERYLADGKAPIPALQELFDKFSKYLKEIYGAIVGTAIDVKISPEAKAVFDKLLAGPTAKPAPQAKTQAKTQTKTGPAPKVSKPTAPVDEISAKREYMDALRRKYGFPQYFPGDPVTDQMVTDEAVQALDAVKNGRPSKYKVGQDLVNELEGRDRGPDAVEVALLVHEAKVLDAKLARAYGGLEGSNSDRQTNELSADIARMEEQLRVIFDMVSTAGSAAGRMLQSFKKVWDNKFDLVRMTAAYLRDKRAATGDTKATVSPEERKQIREINTRLKERKKALDDAVAAKEKEIRAKEADALVKTVARDVKDKKAPARANWKKEVRASLDTKGAAERMRARGFGVSLEQRDTSNTARFNELTRDLPANPTQADLDAWKVAHPDEYAELKAMREKVLLEAGYDVEAWHAGTTAGIKEFKSLTHFGSDIRQLAGIKNRRKALKEDPADADYSVLLKLKNPKRVEDTWNWADRMSEAVAEGHDGLIYKNYGEGFNTEDGATFRDSYVPADPTQIKSTEPLSLSPDGKPITPDQWGDTGSPSILYQQDLDPETLDDLATIGAGLILDQDLKSIDDFTAAIVDAMGPEAMDYSQEIYQRAQDKIEAARKSRKIPKSPEQLLKEVDPEKELSNRMVFNMVRGYLLQDMEPNKVLRQVHKDLQTVWEGITFEEVSDAFTGYGKIKYPSTETINVALRKLRNVERINRQLNVVRSGQAPKKTGFQRDKPDPDIRKLQKKLKAAMKDAGIRTTKSNQLKSSLDAIKTRFRNELEDLQRALDKREALPPKKAKEEYDQETKDLKARVDKKRAEYASIFENKTLTEKQQLKQALASIKRSIAEEEDMLAKGILSKPKTSKRVFDDPEFKAAEARLNALREARHAAQRALRPRKSQEQIALDAAIRENKKGLARDEERVRTGDTAPRSTTSRFTPNDELRAILAERASLKQILKLQRQQKARLGKPERDAARQEHRAAEAIERSLDKIEKRIQELASGVVTPPRRILPFTTPGLSAARALRDSRRRTLLEMEKALKTTKSAEQIREERMVKAANAKKLRYQEMLDKGITSKSVRASAPVEEAVDKARFEAAQVEAEWNKLRSKMLWENRTLPSKVWSRVKTGLRATGVLRLGGDLGLLRHAGVWSLSNFWRHPFKTAGALRRVVRHGMTERGAYEIYQSTAEALALAGFSDKDIRLLNPMEPPGTAGRSRSGEEITGADILDMASKLPKKTVIGLGARGLRAIEFFNTSILNIARAETALALRGNLDLPMSDNVRKAISVAAEVSSGRGNVTSENIERAIPFLNDWVFISARWTISRIQMFFGYPLWSTKMSWDTRAKIFHEVYLKTLIGRAIMASMLAALFKPEDDETPEDFFARVFKSMGFGNPLDSSYGKLKLSNGFTLDLAQGVSPLMGVFARVTTGRTVRDGEVVDLRDEEKGRIVDSYLKNRANMVTASLIRTVVTGRAYGGERLPSLSRIYRTLEGTEEYPVDGPMLAQTAQEWFAPIIAADTVNIYKQFGPKGVVLWSAMMTGAGVQSYKAKEKKEKFY